MYSLVCPRDIVDGACGCLGYLGATADRLIVGRPWPGLARGLSESTLWLARGLFGLRRFSFLGEEASALPGAVDTRRPSLPNGPLIQL